MPTYQYACTECGEPHEAVQSFTDAALTECPACGGPLRKVFSAVGVVFKGSGFYQNDSRKSEAKAGAEAKGEGKTESKTEATSDGKTEAKSGTTPKADAPAASGKDKPAASSPKVSPAAKSA